MSSGIEVDHDSTWELKQKDLTTLTDNLIGWDVVKKAPHQVWHTLEGRTAMEKRLRALVKAAARLPPYVADEEE